jgi:hypothetical protein
MLTSLHVAQSQKLRDLAICYAADSQTLGLADSLITSTLLIYLWPPRFLHYPAAAIGSVCNNGEVAGQVIPLQQCQCDAYWCTALASAAVDVKTISEVLSLHKRVSRCAGLVPSPPVTERGLCVNLVPLRMYAALAAGVMSYNDACLHLHIHPSSFNIEKIYNFAV